MKLTCCDAHPSYTKGCEACKAVMRKYTVDNNERIRAQQNARYKREHKHVREVANANRKRNAEHYRQKAAEWRAKHPERYRELMRIDYYKHQEQRKNGMKQWKMRNAEYFRDYRLLMYETRRVKMLELLGGKCKDCGVTDPRILQINHLKGGGRKDLARGSAKLNQFYNDLAAGKLPKEDFDVRCANHNVLYEYQMGRRRWLLELPKEK